MKRFAIFDIGGQSVRLAIINDRGDFLWLKKIAVSVFHINKRVEHDPEEIMAACRTLMTSYMEWSPVAITTFALATQRSSIISWSKLDAKPLTKIISWQDTRGDDLLDDIVLESSLKQSVSVNDIEYQIKAVTGLYPSAHYGASKISLSVRKLKRLLQYSNHKHGQSRCITVTPLASWILVQLEIMFDAFNNSNNPLVVSNSSIDEGQAQRTMLWNIKTCDWDAELMQLFAIPREVLPKVTSNVISSQPTISGFSTTCSLMIGDQAAALFAHGMPRMDTCYINAGTGAFLLKPYKLSQAPSIPNVLLDTIIYRDENTSLNAIEATVNGAASALAYCDVLTGIKEAQRPSYRSLNVLGENACFLNGVSGLASPWWKPVFKSRFINTDTVSEKYQAVYESILFLIKHNFDCIYGTQNIATQVVFSGGLSLDLVFCQALATLLKTPVYRSTMHEATLQGAAYLLTRYTTEIVTGKGSHDSVQRNFDNAKFEWAEPLSEPDLLFKRYYYWLAEMDEAVKESWHAKL